MVKSIQFVAAAVLAVALLAGCGDFALSNLMPKGGPSRWGKAEIKPDIMARYLEECDLGTNYLVSSTVGQLAKGRRFRERVRDQRGRWTLATVWIDADEPNVLHVQTMRDGPCPDCNGTGVRRSGLNLSVDFMCRRCKGSGIVSDLVDEKRYVLTSTELERPLPGHSPLSAAVLAEQGQPQALSAEEKQHIAGMVEKSPQDRVEAIKWLDTYYVRLGVFFMRLEPMLRKAIRQESDPKTNIRIYQFKAGGKAVEDKAYYRIFVDMQTGKVVRKNFVALADANKNPFHVEGMTSKLTEKTESIKNWFTEGWEKKPSRRFDSGE